MSTPQEHNYRGLSEPLPPSSSSLSTGSERNAVLNLKETELRLGLPGSELLEKRVGFGFSLFGKDLKDEGNNNNGFCKSFVSGAKRGFSDAINGSGKWGLNINGGSEVELGKGDNLFSPRSNGGCKSNNNSLQQSGLGGSSVKEVVKLVEEKKNEVGNSAPASKTQVVGWPPIRSFRKNTLSTNPLKSSDQTEKSGSSCLYVKVSMDSAPYLRKIDLKTYCSYSELSSALEKMFSCFTIGKYSQGHESLSESRLMDLIHGSEYVLTYEDKDGDWMLVGDVPWEMFTDSCKRLRIMKGSDAIGLAPRTMQKCKSQN